jgi:hypothetical protein
MAKSCICAPTFAGYATRYCRPRVWRPRRRCVNDRHGRGSRAVVPTNSWRVLIPYGANTSFFEVSKTGLTGEAPPCQSSSHRPYREAHPKAPLNQLSHSLPCPQVVGELQLVWTTIHDIPRDHRSLPTFQLSPWRPPSFSRLQARSPLGIVDVHPIADCLPCDPKDLCGHYLGHSRLYRGDRLSANSFLGSRVERSKVRPHHAARVTGGASYVMY